MTLDHLVINSAPVAAPSRTGASGVIERWTRLLDRIPYSLVFAARIFPAAVFGQSGQTKVEGWRISENAIYLFREDYKLRLIDPVVAAPGLSF